MADRFTEMNGGEISVNDIIYAVPEDTGEPASVEITETDATSGIVWLSGSLWMGYKNPTGDSAATTAYEDGESSEEAAFRTRKDGAR